MGSQTSVVVFKIVAKRVLLFRSLFLTYETIWDVVGLLVRVGLFYY